MGNAVAAWLHNAKRADNGAGDAIKEVDRPSEGVEKPCKRARNHEGDAFSASQADRLRNQFPEDHVDGAEDRERERERGGMGEYEHAPAAICRQELLESFCRSRLPQV